MWHAVYDSPWQHPGIAWVAGGVVLLATLVRRPRAAFLGLFLLLQLEIMLDAWFTSGLSPVGSTGRAADIAGVVFVILGDLRYFYLVLRQRMTRSRALILGVAVSLIVPVATGVLRVIDPQRFSGNFLFMVYELLALAIVIALAHRARGSLYGRRLLVLEVTQYALWAIADALILAGYDVGYVVRIVPNVVYYALFVPVATWSVPDGIVV